MLRKKYLCEFCKAEKKPVISFNKKLKNENLFGLEKIRNYQRTIFYCKKCLHYSNIHKYENFLSKVYSQLYSRNSYGDLKKRFLDIYRKKKFNSSNYHRMKYLINFIKKKKIKVNKALDIGSGIGIFPYSMEKRGFKFEFCEKDKKNYNFLKHKLKLKPFSNDIINDEIPRKEIFDLITLNKVLEHLNFKSIQIVLKKILKLLTRKGILYIELPDAEKSAKIGFERQEFFLEHFHIFSKKSALKLMFKSNFVVEKIYALKEVNNKFTIRIIAKKKIKKIAKF